MFYNFKLQLTNKCPHKGEIR